MILFLFSELLFYNLSYGFIHAGKLIMEKKDTVMNNDTLICLMSVLTSNPSLSFLFKINDTLISITDKNIRPLYFERIIHEGRFNLHERIKFDRERGKIIYNTGEEFPLPKDNVFDILSVYYYLRSLRLSPSCTTDIFVHVSKKTEKYRIFVSEVSGVKVKDKYYECYKITPILINGKDHGKLMISYTTRDDRKLPVLLIAKLGIGSIKGELEKWE